MRWTSHQFGSRWPDRSFPDNSLDEASNFCRKPDGNEGPPWCYYGPHKDQWEACDLPQCGMSKYINSILRFSDIFLS